MSAAERAISRLMYWLRDDLYHERPHGRGYAMENPPGTIRVEFDEQGDDDFRCVVRFSGALASKDDLTLFNPDEADLDEVLP